MFSTASTPLVRLGLLQRPINFRPSWRTVFVVLTSLVLLLLTIILCLFYVRPSHKASTTATEPITNNVTVFNYGNDVVRGVNLGGWLVIEVRLVYEKLQGGKGE